MILRPTMRLIIYYTFQTAKHHPRQASKIAICSTCTGSTVGMYIHIANRYYSTRERCGVQQLFSSPCRMLMSFVTESIGYWGSWSIGDDGIVLSVEHTVGGGG